MRFIHVIQADEQLEPRTGLIIERDVRRVHVPGQRSVLKPYTSVVHFVVKAFGRWLRISRHSAEHGITPPILPRPLWEMAHGKVYP